MNNQLNILYAADNNYAPFLGVSMYSLFKNNRDFKKIRVYAILDKVSEENKKLLKSLAGTYNRELITIDAEEFNIQLEKLGIPKYRGNYVTNYRLFWDTIISDDVKRLIYLDCDTIICGSLKKIVEDNFKGFSAGVVLDSLGRKYKQIIGFNSETPYFNAGVLIIDVDNWKKNKVSELILNHTNNVRSKYCNPDQDLLNINLKDKIKLFGPEYNFQPVHRAYTDGVYYRVYGKKYYYTAEQIENARKNPVILHTYRFLGEFPWHKGNLHPDNNIFNQYLRESPWSNYLKEKKKLNILFKVEKILYCILPKLLFLGIFAYVQNISFNQQEKKIKKSL